MILGVELSSVLMFTPWKKYFDRNKVISTFLELLLKACCVLYTIYTPKVIATQPERIVCC